GFHVYQLAEDGALEPPRNPQFKYGDTPMVIPNKQALAAWKAHARENNYRLVVMMIPPKGFFDQTDRYAEFKRFLDSQEIEHIDLTQEFRARSLAASDLYWDADFHLNEGGNKTVSEVLFSRLVPRYGNRQVPDRDGGRPN